MPYRAKAKRPMGRLAKKNQDGVSSKDITRNTKKYARGQARKLKTIKKNTFRKARQQKRKKTLTGIGSGQTMRAMKKAVKRRGKYTFEY